MGLNVILKAMIFVNNINKKRAIVKYLYIRFLNNLYFHLNVSNKSRKLFMKNFFQRNI